METKSINLHKYRGNKSTVFTGRPQGEEARKELLLDELDKVDTLITLIIPENTTSFNPSFFLGLLYESIKTLGIDKFEDKYKFQINDDNQIVKNIILSDIQDGKRSAINSIMGKSGFDRFLK